MAWWRRTLTIADLLDIDRGRVNRSKDLKVEYVGTENILRKMSLLDKIFRIFKRGPKLIYYKIVRYKVTSNSGNIYTVLIKVSPGFDTKQFMKNKVEVFCTCADFKYRAAYELNQTDNLVLIKATKEHLGIAITQAPTKVVTTPICKHIFAVLDHFRTHLKQLDLVY
jgi:hypothetical protein